MAATREITLTVPLGTQIHNNSDPHLICRDTLWTDIAVFYIGNYVTHVATVRTDPGELISSILTTLLCCLFFPVTGVTRGLKAIWSLSFYHILKGRNLRAATRAGALCMVVRDIDWEPSTSGGDKVSYCRVPPPATSHGTQNEDTASDNDVNMTVGPHSGIPLETLRRPVASRVFSKLTFYCPPGVGQVDGIMLELTHNIHGSYSLPKGYTLATVPVDSKVEWFETREVPSARRTAEDVASSRAEASAARQVDDITYSGSLVKAIVSILQLVFTVASLYRASGNQIDKFGYAAFGLTVAPYAVMSFINLLANALAVEFPKLYMVHSPIMEEALTRGATFRAVVGSLVPAATDPSTTMVGGILRTVQDDPHQYVFESEEMCGATIENGVTQWEIKEPSSDDEAAEMPISNTLAPRPRRAFSRQKDPADCSWKPQHGVVAIPICEPIDRYEPSRFQRLWERSQRIDRNHSIIGQRDDWDEKKIPRHAHFATGDASYTTSNFFWNGLPPYIPITVCLAIIGGLSGWRKGESTLAQRVWTMMWLVFGFLFNLKHMAGQSYPAVRQLYMASKRPASTLDAAMLNKDHDEEMGPQRRPARRSEEKLKRLPGTEFGLSFVLAGLIYAAPAVGGFVVVGQMLQAYGTCFRIF